MAKKFDLLVFDWDGTLLDSTAAIAASFKAACRDLYLAEPSDEQARHIIGLGLSDALRHCVPDISDEQLPHLIERYRFHYLSGDQNLKLFPGIRDLLADLVCRGHVLAVATGKGRVGLDRAMSHSGLGEFFSATRCVDECFSKPHPQMLFDLMSSCSAPAERTLMIGDTTHDLQMAVNAGVAGLAVTYGAHAASSLAALASVAQVDTVNELSEWLAGHA